MCRGTQQMALPCAASQARRAASQARPEGEEARRAQVGLAGLPQRDKMSRVGHSLVFTTASRRSTDRLLAPARLPRDSLRLRNTRRCVRCDASASARLNAAGAGSAAANRFRTARAFQVE
jgi:hypothetical protein